MGLFSRKIPSRDGLAALAASTALTAIDLLGPSVDAIRVASAAAGYFRCKAEEVKASEDGLARYYEVVWSNILLQRPEVHERFLVFAAHSVPAAKIFKEKGIVAGVKEFVQWAGAIRPWDTDDETVTNNLLLLLDQGDRYLAEHKRSWRPS